MVLCCLFRHPQLTLQHDNPRRTRRVLPWYCLHVIFKKGHLEHYKKLITFIPEYWRFIQLLADDLVRNSVVHHPVNLWYYAIPDDRMFPDQRWTNTFCLLSKCVTLLFATHRTCFLTRQWPVAHGTCYYEYSSCHLIYLQKRTSGTTWEWDFNHPGILTIYSNSWR